MQTKQIIQASANVIRITNIAKGNIYKRFDDNYTWLGIVRVVHNDGVKAIIEATEYRDSWSSIDVKEVVISGDKDYTIFPATLEDFDREFNRAVDKLEDKIKDSEKVIAESKKQIEFTKKLVSGELQKELTTPKFSEMTQEEFKEKVGQLGI